MSTSRRHGKHSSAPKPGDEAVDYSGELATQVTPDEGAKPTAPGSIEIDYQAAARKPSRPPNYDLQNHYNDHGSSQHRVYKTYNGPNHFAPGPIEQGTRTDTQVTDHDLESLVEINHTPTPVPAGLRRAGQSITTRDEEDITTTQYQGRPVRLPTRLPTRPSAAVQVRQLPAAGQRVSAGLDEDTSADNADDVIISVVGIPSSDEDHEPPTLTPPAPQQLLPRLPPPPPTQPPPPPAQPPPPPARAPAPPQAPLLRVDAAPTPTPVSALRPSPPPRPATAPSPGAQRRLRRRRVRARRAAKLPLGDPRRAGRRADPPGDHHRLLPAVDGRALARAPRPHRRPRAHARARHRARRPQARPQARA